MTSREAAKDFIKNDVVYGVSIERIRAGMGGCHCNEYAVSIGGYVGGKRIATDKIVVFKLNGTELKPPEIFNLKELYDEIKQVEKQLRLI